MKWSMRLNVSWLLLLWRKEGGDCNQAVSKVVVVVFTISVSALVNAVSLLSLRNLGIFSLWTSFHEALKVVVGFLSSMDFFLHWVFPDLT